MLKENEMVPSRILLEDLNNKQVSLSNFEGKFVVLYFYPKDNTPGCTKEACSFRDYNKEIKKLGVEIIGVSKDSVTSHQKFQNEHNLNFILLSDSSHKLMEAFGVWSKKSFLGKTYMGTLRSTFIIDPQGKIFKVWEKVNPLNHAQEVYDFLVSIIK
ncbi:hypothetical protein A2296_02605 [candidate division CPR3 bacterium RIFOXYB2_FULL_35_8]|nr:MAG: hypothetical protein A2250_00025 [candidate division CPR3 bacterium RIFOXYA2_FULL_35_13]OGB79056.1 MAG: hypothetical protein A2296_02605 [candidate division CPR3 bacterium RIFOXYB2_FULL_35_8]